MATAKLPDGFQDFDSENVLQSCKKRVFEYGHRNFILDFNKDKAQCALDVDLNGLQKALDDRETRIKGAQETRWINIECPETKSERELVKCLGKKYGFSSRLLYSMLSHPMAPKPQPTQLPLPSKRQEFLNPRRAHRMKAAIRKESTFLDKQAVALHDLESSAGGPEDNLESNDMDLNHYSLVNDVWHFMSVDWGYDYVCIGYNSIHGLRAPSADETMYKDLPDAKRLYTWLVLCQDGTVISIHENPFPEGNSKEEQLTLVRANLENVFKQISKAPGRKPNSNILAVQVRARDGPASGSELPVTDSDSPSLLLYYLFDDWSTTYGLIARRADHYGRRLDKVRDEMISAPKLDQVHKLHYYGRQLSILKRIYKSYALIIERVLKGPQSYIAPRDFGGDDDEAMQESVGDLAVKASSTQKITYGVPLSTPAALRFERLKDRIHLYALSEIQACLDEKESLMTLNFNLITIKESSYIERLTRITILLAKISILFIPVTFMSSYFTVPFTNTGYEPVTYWIAFAVIFTLSFVGIIIFGQLSGTQESKPIYTSLTQATVNYWRKLLRLDMRKRREEKMDE